MKFKTVSLLVILLALLTTSCKLSQETKYYSDKSASAEITLRLDPSISKKMSASKDGDKKVHGKNISELPTDWISFYDLGLKDTLKISENSDTALFLKSIFIKYIIDNGQFAGFGMKAQRLSEKDMLEFAKRFSSMNPGQGADTMRPASAMDPVPNWDGKTLTITFKDNKKSTDKNKEEKKKKTEKDKNDDMFASMFKDVNVVMTYRYSFEKKIRKIKGKHDFLKKVDDYTVVYELDFKKIMEMSDKGKSIRKSDPVIVITTE